MIKIWKYIVHSWNQDQCRCISPNCHTSWYSPNSEKVTARTKVNVHIQESDWINYITFTKGVQCTYKKMRKISMSFYGMISNWRRRRKKKSKVHWEPIMLQFTLQRRGYKIHSLLLICANENKGMWARDRSSSQRITIINNTHRRNDGDKKITIWQILH